MARPEWRDPAKERFWRGMVRDWQRGELTIREFCARRELAEHNFHAWRRTLVQRDRERARAARAGAARAGAARAGAVQSRVAPAARSLDTFVPLQVVCEARPTIEIVLSGGTVVRVQAGVDDTTLRQVLAALMKDRQETEELPC